MEKKLLKFYINKLKRKERLLKDHIEEKIV